MSTPDDNKPQSSFKSEEEMWAYIEEKEDILNQLQDAFTSAKRPPANEQSSESPPSFENTERLALEGDPISQFNLALAFQKGEGVARDFEKAAYWWLKSAENGFAPAQYNVGCYWRDANDLQRAQEWFLMAAKQNYGPAQFNLGTIYGEVSDYARAYVWFYLAEQNRVEHAKENRDKAAGLLSKDELNEARVGLSAMMLDLKQD